MQHIETVELASAAASITFSSIPDTFTDLLIVASLRQDEGAPNAFPLVTFNSASLSNYSARFLDGDGSAVGSSTYTTIYWQTTKPADTANTFGSVQIYIPNYRSAVAKSVSIDNVYENNATANRLRLAAGLWNDTSAITSVILHAGGNSATPQYNFVQYSSASLYGITAGSDGIVAVS